MLSRDEACVCELVLVDVKHAFVENLYVGASVLRVVLDVYAGLTVGMPKDLRVVYGRLHNSRTGVLFGNKTL